VVEKFFIAIEVGMRIRTTTEGVVLGLNSTQSGFRRSNLLTEHRPRSKSQWLDVHIDEVCGEGSWEVLLTRAGRFNLGVQGRYYSENPSTTT
jgi:hypothetical protein